MALNKQVFTDNGIDMLGQANAGATLVIARIVVGAGSATQDSDIFPLDELIDWKTDVTITSKQDLGDGKMLVRGTLNEWEMGAGPPFQLRELGIMAHIAGTQVEDTVAQIGQKDTGEDIFEEVPSTPTTGPIGPSGQPLVGNPLTKGTAPTPTVDPSDLLYCASNVYADAPDTVTPGGTVSRSFDITIEIDRATNVTIIIGGVGTYDCQNIPTTPPPNSGGWYAGREGNVFDFKRVIQGVGIIIEEEADRITISQAVIPDDMTELYVPASHPSCPRPEQAFATIQAAHDYTLNYRIPSNKVVNIHVYYAGGVGTPNGQPLENVTGAGIVFIHPDSRQIHLIGEPRRDVNVSQINPVDSTHKDALCVNTTLNIGTRGYLYNCHGGWVGGAKITSKPANGVRLSIFNRSGLTPYGTQDGPGGVQRRFSWYPTVLAYSGTPVAGQNVLTCYYGIGSIQNICFEGGWYTVVINSGGGAIHRCMFMGSRRGLTCGEGSYNFGGNGTQTNEEVVACDCDFGIIIGGSLNAVGQTIVNGCGDGVTPGSIGMGAYQVGLTQAILFVNHCARGVIAYGNGSFLGGNIYYVYNAKGLVAQAGGTLTINANQAPSVALGNTIDLYAQGGGYIDFSQGTPAQNPSSNPAHDTFQTTPPFNNQLAFIHFGI